jgi:hypothetical protein
VPGYIRERILAGDNMADKNRTQEKSKKAMTKKARLKKKKEAKP